MKEVIIQGVPMILAGEVYEAIERLDTSRQLYCDAAAAKQAQLDAIREALHGAPDCDLVALAAATYAASLQFAPYVQLEGTIYKPPTITRTVDSGNTEWHLGKE